MAVGELVFYSAALGRLTEVSVVLPDPAVAGPGPYAGLLQLHGAGDNHTSWITRSSIARRLEGVPIVAVFPSGALSYWSDWRLDGPGTAYETYLMQDLLPSCRAYFNLRSGPWAIGGLSMGGYGALRLGMKYPDTFASIYAHSSVTDYTRSPSWTAIGPENQADADLRVHARAVRGRGRLPKVSFDCGVSDFLIDQNREFHRYLDEIGLEHTYHEYPGAHDWDYWDEHVREAIAQHRDVLSL